MPIYNKLVRDLIPEVIEKNGKNCTTRILAPEDHLTEIKLKMQEEALEFKDAEEQKDAVEELADILELVHAALAVYEVTYEELEQVRLEKKVKRGGFSEGIYLLEVEDI
ncbi:nucleoside triphosphate pyrophosphohydrolase [Viridibacillus sp. YIM B01967]|uniref:Nucleoside triphosphate pyrophosphohydrolase n=1 Tax=Viridibacillus soli TaxID=2798301 RepID=A0ABS1HDJ2_9BACL|nr:nucleoside triphosphate pyrophosphohydrolase [Viridibacillus soli]MBK3497406.1 nucleoside triphosphate pyrophosphohydrolase [Viridibacillus soli]